MPDRYTTTRAAVPWLGARPDRRGAAAAFDDASRGGLRAALVLIAALSLAACESIGSIFGGADTQDEQKGKVTAVTPPPVAKRPSADDTKPTRESIRSVQRMLSQLGFSPGAADGVFGRRTAQAIRQFQKKHGMPQDGEISKALVAKLTQTFRNASSLDGASAPVYEVGDRFVYSDGLVETATNVKGNKVLWETNQNAIFTAYKNFILPPVFREAEGRSERTSIDTTSGALWPLKVGKKVSFTAVTEVTLAGKPDSRKRSTVKWTCHVAGTESVSVAAGSFDAFRVLCSGIEQATDLKTENIWYYAPSVGHYVRLIQQADGTRKNIDLVAIRLAGAGWPPAARAGLGWAFKHALETKSEGESVEWSSSGVDTNVTIRPTTALKSDDPLYCRNFEQIVDRPKGRRMYPGKACRNSAGEWSIPGLETGAARNPRS